MKKYYNRLLASYSASLCFKHHSDAFKPTFVDTLVDPYLTIQEGLAGDDLEFSKVGTTAFLKATESASS